MEVITKNKWNNRYSLDKFSDLRFSYWPNIIVLENAIVKGLLIICANKKFWQYYSIIVSINIDYEKQVVIIGIK